MTTKWKIIAGFTVVILLMGVVATIGYRSLSDVAKIFTDYQRLAVTNVSYSDIVANQNGFAAVARLFRLSRDARLLDEGRSLIAQNQEMIARSRAASELEVSKTILEEARKQTEEELQVLLQLDKNLRELLDLYANVLQPMQNTFGEDTVKLIKLLVADSNDSAAGLSSALMNNLALVRSAASRAVFDRTAENAARMKEALETLVKSIRAIQPLLQNDQEHAHFAKIQAGYEEMDKAIASMTALIKVQAEQNDRLLALNNAIKTEMGELSENADKLMGQFGAEGLKLSDSAQSLTLASTAAGLIVGVLLAVFIIIGLVRVLRNMDHFASAIADGDFQAQVPCREKGEIGHTLTAMRKIPTVLQSILDTYQSLEKNIEKGDLAAKGDAAAYNGGFSTLVAGTNSALGRFRMIVENIPSPVLMLDQDLKATYMNAAGRGTMGEEYKGKTCRELINREDFGSASDALKQATESLRPASAETVAHPRGANMDISYTSMPMLNQEGKLATVLQVITDLTSIKQTQRTIRSVADQAATISNRVAAASEELSAQVEQVSRGADIQRSRVKSTASAMSEMNSTVLEVAKNASQASEQSELTKNKAGEGAALVGNVMHSINLVNTVAGNLQTNMRELGTKAESIGGVINVISDIADQTNLLALNAAIEAARAGDAGRGFAVVADEVRKLAEKTMAATQEVGANITAIQHSTQTNINEVNKAAKAITEATELANTSGQALTEIVNLASANFAVVASIATAAEEQSATSEEINRAIEEINRIVGETAQGMVQSSAAVQELSRMAHELNHVMDELQ
jgi:methyl-accepting chemotaxis protein